MPVDVTVVIPTFNEAGNIGELLRRLDHCLRGITWEAVVVDDDSADGTGALVVALGQDDARIRCLSRVGRRAIGSNNRRLPGLKVSGPIDSMASLLVW